MKENQEKNSKINVKTILIISTILVLFIPMLYSTIYLGAFWDPYDNLGNVPVAFVNLDKAVTKDGKTYEIGNDLEAKLKDNKSVAWKFVGKDEADKGLMGTSYYAVVTIPEDFSETISSVDKGKSYEANILYSANKGKNYIFSQLSKKITENIKEEISNNIQKEISKSLIDNMYNMKDSIKDVAGGVVKLQEGTSKLSDGGVKLSKGTFEAEQGAIKLQDGMKSASDGTKELKNGVELLSVGGTRLLQGIDSTKAGSEKLQMGLVDLSHGEEKLVGGASQLVKGLEDFKSGITQSSNSIMALVDGANSLSSYNSKIAKDTEQLNNSLNSKLNNAADSLKASQDNIGSISEAMKLEIQSIENSDMKSEDKERLKSSILSLEKISQESKNPNVEKSLREASNALDPLSQGMKELELETKKVAQGVSVLSSSLKDTQSQASGGLDKLIVGAKAVQDGSQGLLLGLNTVSQKTGELSDGLGQVHGGFNSLNEGLLSVKNGATSLSGGLETAYLRTGEFSAGLKNLNSGANSLSRGINSLNDGATELKTDLSKGYEELDSKLKFNSDDMSTFISNPVSLKEESINNINHYGEGLAPYFLSLSLWLGALLINLIISIMQKVKIGEESYLKGFTRKLLFGIGLASIQSVFLSLSLVLILKIELVSMSGFYLSNMFISAVFFSVMYGVSYAIGNISSPIMFIFFLLQISSAGGTFPVETAPMFYKTINHVIPMTYSVNLLRMVISGINAEILNHNLIVLLEFMAFSLVGGFFINKIINKNKGKKTQNIIGI